jgi:hypothetical protein
MSPLHAFLFGFLGSLAVEVLQVNTHYDTSGAPPKTYKLFGFWLARGLLAVVAGGLAVGYGATAPIMAIHIGISTPVIFQALARGNRPPEIPPPHQ